MSQFAEESLDRISRFIAFLSVNGGSLDLTVPRPGLHIDAEAMKEAEERGLAAREIDFELGLVFSVTLTPAGRALMSVGSEQAVNDNVVHS